MTDRDRLVELNRKAKLYAQEKADERGGLVCIDDEVDYLLANGVSVLPLPIGTTVYEIRARGRRRIMWSSRKCDYSIINDGYIENAKAHDLEFYIRDKSFVKADCSRWNKTVFSTKEQAEEKLKTISG